MTTAEIDKIADHVMLRVYETPGGDWCISKHVTIGRHETWEPVARFSFGPLAKTFANETARMLGDFYATDDIQVAE